MTTSASKAIPDYNYTIYLRAAPEQVWHALTDAELTATCSPRRRGSSTPKTAPRGLGRTYPRQRRRRPSERRQIP